MPPSANGASEASASADLGDALEPAEIELLALTRQRPTREGGDPDATSTGEILIADSGDEPDPPLPAGEIDVATLSGHAGLSEPWAGEPEARYGRARIASSAVGMSEACPTAPDSLSCSAGIMQPPTLKVAEIQPSQLIAAQQHTIRLRIGSREAGRIPIVIDRADNILIGVGGLLGAVRDRMDPAVYSRLAATSGASAFVNIERLRALGFTIGFDNRTESLVLTAR
jgi:hypothetical protein